MCPILRTAIKLDQGIKVAFQGEPVGVRMRSLNCDSIGVKVQEGGQKLGFLLQTLGGPRLSPQASKWSLPWKSLKAQQEEIA